MLPLCGCVIGFTIIILMVTNCKRRQRLHPPTDADINEIINQWNKHAAEELPKKLNRMALDRSNKNETN